MINAVEGDRPRAPEHDFATGLRSQLDVEAFVARRCAVPEHVAIDPDDRVADMKSSRRRPEFHLVDDDRMHAGCGCRRAEGGQGEDGSRDCKRQRSKGG